MSFLKNIFGHKGPYTEEQFWYWFQKNERSFYHVIKNQGDITAVFFDKLGPELEKFHYSIFYLAGMYDDITAELVLTADGWIPAFGFIEDLVAKAPKITGWRFTALKPELDIENVKIEYEGFEFDGTKLSFYSNDSKDHPDEIDLVFVHRDCTSQNSKILASGTYLYLDNLLGELEFAESVDNVTVVSPKEATKELVPIEKLKSFLKWRKKEFVEKYDGIRRSTDNDSYALMEAELPGGNKLIATVNQDVLKWDRKASHPWILCFEIRYDGSNSNGMPAKSMFPILDEIEDTLCKELKDSEGYINIGRQTAESKREIYFACKEYRKASKIAYGVQKRYDKKIELGYEIYKDKYWRSFDRFVP